MKRSRFPLFLLLPVVLCGCEGETSAPLSPSDDPFDYQINTAVAYELKLSPHRWVIPAPNLPALAAPMDANNNLDIILHQGRLFLAKRTAIYKIDRQQKKVVLLQDLPSAGDTAFASVRRTGPHTYLLANYTSPLDDPDASWLKAQASPRGTQIYFMDLTFVPRK